MTQSDSATGVLVVTSISAPNPVLQSLAVGSAAHGIRFIVIGDSKSPATFELQDCDFFSLEAQRKLPYRYAALCPERSYARKNIGYLEAISKQPGFIFETDDDNFPRDSFWGARHERMDARTTAERGWINAYGWFTDSFIYPRGFPLTHVRNKHNSQKKTILSPGLDCPIQQGLADDNPDVDAVYRMLYPLPFTFRDEPPLALASGQWCPFNSQNTTFFPKAFPLLYLPAFCSFRMTDIWRSFVAQRICWEYGWSVAFHAATVYQDRNEHDLLRDFEDEIPGYLLNRKIADTLGALKLSSSPDSIFENLSSCYQALIALGAVGEQETPLLNAWIADLKSS